MEMTKLCIGDTVNVADAYEAMDYLGNNPVYALSDHEDRGVVTGIVRVSEGGYRLYLNIHTHVYVFGGNELIVVKLPTDSQPPRLAAYLARFAGEE